MVSSEPLRHSHAARIISTPIPLHSLRPFRFSDNVLYDNSSSTTRVHTWLEEQTKTGKLDVTSGYFTVGILSFISRLMNDKIETFRFVLGDIVANDEDRENPINLLTESDPEP